MDILFVFILMIGSFGNDFFCYFFHLFGLEELEKLEREITFNNI